MSTTPQRHRMRVTTGGTSRTLRPDEAGAVILRLARDNAPPANIARKLSTAPPGTLDLVRDALVQLGYGSVLSTEAGT